MVKNHSLLACLLCEATLVLVNKNPKYKEEAHTKSRVILIYRIPTFAGALQVSRRRRRR